MNRFIVIVFSVLIVSVLLAVPMASAGQAVDAATAAKIAQAVKALPESMRDGASVVEYDAEGYRTVLREGTNSMVCEPDDPDTEGFRVSCYHKNRIARLNFERQMAATGKEPMEVFHARSQMVDAGRLPLPIAGQMAYFLSGETEATATPGRSIRLPFATGESTALPTERDADEGIWLMQAGTNRAHVMVIGNPSGMPATPDPSLPPKVAEAVLAAPKALRAGATVVEYDAQGERHVLRQGTNTLVCEPDDPGTEGFGVQCYHEGHVPRVSFEKKLAASGMERMDVFRKRIEAVEAGKVPLPVAGQMQYMLFGDSLETATQRGGAVRMPYATSHLTGLPTERSDDGIWLMQEGTNRAHVMLFRP